MHMCHTLCAVRESILGWVNERDSIRVYGLRYTRARPPKNPYRRKIDISHSTRTHTRSTLRIFVEIRKTLDFNLFLESTRSSSMEMCRLFRWDRYTRAYTHTHWYTNTIALKPVAKNANCISLSGEAIVKFFVRIDLSKITFRPMCLCWFTDSQSNCTHSDSPCTVRSTNDSVSFHLSYQLPHFTCETFRLW